MAKSKSPSLGLSPGPGKELSQSADLVFSPQGAFDRGWRCLLRGPVRAEKEACSVPGLPARRCCPLLLFLRLPWLLCSLIHPSPVTHLILVIIRSGRYGWTLRKPGLG